MDKLTELLKRLHEAKVEFSLIGGLAAVHYGSSVITDDADVCTRFNTVNLRRIEAALGDLHPRHRLTANRLPLELTDELCISLKNLYLKTDWGMLDCLGEVSGIGDFDTVMSNSRLVNFPFGQIHMLTLDALIRAKRAAGRDHDVVVVRQLEAIKERTSQQQNLI